MKGGRGKEDDAMCTSCCTRTRRECVRDGDDVDDRRTARAAKPDLALARTRATRLNSRGASSATGNFRDPRDSARSTATSTNEDRSAPRAREKEIRFSFIRFINRIYHGTVGIIKGHVFEGDNSIAQNETKSTHAFTRAGGS